MTIMGMKAGASEADALRDEKFYEVSCEGMTPERSVIGWTKDPTGGALVRLVDAHPSWFAPRVRDIREKS
jgi:hypothetical protein